MSLEWKSEIACGKSHLMPIDDDEGEKGRSQFHFAKCWYDYSVRRRQLDEPQVGVGVGILPPMRQV